VIRGTNGYSFAGLTQDAINEANLLYRTGRRVDHVAFTPTGRILFVYNGNGCWQNGIPLDMNNAITKINTKKMRISCIAFTPDNGWLVTATSSN
jgi:hypothetical protein